MKRNVSFVLGFGLCGLLVALAGQVSGQDAKTEPKMEGMTPEMQQQMAEYLKNNMPGEAHKQLDYFVGKWTANIKVYPGGPGSTPMESSGTSEIKWILDGRYLMDEFKGTMMGMPYGGLGLTGHDNYRNIYVSSWCSSTDTQFLTMRGARHPETGTFTYYGEMDEPGLVIGRTVKSRITIVNQDHYKFEMIDLHAGDDYRVFEIDYLRVK
ncbi:MAG: DUF1579 family protein [Planctomycetota bacterium]